LVEGIHQESEAVVSVEREPSCIRSIVNWRWRRRRRAESGQLQGSPCPSATPASLHAPEAIARASHAQCGPRFVDADADDMPAQSPANTGPAARKAGTR
jgi:hypothetical protein